MCKNPEIKATIDKIAFEKRGYMTIYLEDGRILSVPIRNYPNLKQIPARLRENWMILDGQYLTFLGQSQIFSITEFMAVTHEQPSITYEKQRFKKEYTKALRESQEVTSHIKQHGTKGLKTLDDLLNNFANKSDTKHN